MFRGYVNKILPTVYDDSLSYYEVLAKVMAKLNEVIELDNAQNEIINNLPLDVSSFAEELAEFKADMTQQFNDYKEQLNASLDAFEDEVNAKLTTDSSPTEGSTNLVTSGGVYAALKDITDSLIKDALPTQGSDDFVTSGGVYTAIQTAVDNINTVLATKQNALTFDTTPTENSVNPVQSGGIKTYVDTKAGNVQNNLDTYITNNNARSAAIEGDITDLETGKQDNLNFDTVPTLNSQNPVTSDGIARAIAGVTPEIDIDPTPTSGSTNPVSSNGVYAAVNELSTATEQALEEKQNLLNFDVMPTQNSLNPVTSGGVWQAMSQIDPTGTIDPEPTEGSTAAVSSGGTWSALQALNSTLSSEINEKQDALVFDNTPTINSGHPVTSDGIYRALQEKQSTLTFDSTPTQYSTNPVTSGGVYDAIQQGGGGGTIDPVPTENSTNAVQSGGTWTALQGKQNTLTFDTTPTQYSTNPVTSGGVYDAIQQGGGGGGTIDPVPTENSTNAVQSGGTWTALQGKQNTLTFDSTPTENSLNPVTSGGVYAAIQASGGGGGETKTLLFDNQYSNLTQTDVSLNGELISTNTYDVFEIEYIWFDDSAGNNLCYPTIIRVRRDTLYNINSTYTAIYNDGIVLPAISDNFKYFDVYETTDEHDNAITLFEYNSSRSSVTTNIKININRIWGISGANGGGSWISSTPEMHRNIFRNNNLGTTLTAAQLSAISDGSFDNLFVGDYWTSDETINGETVTVKWRIADLDYFYRKGKWAVQNIMVHHIIVIPDVALRKGIYSTDFTDDNTMIDAVFQNHRVTAYFSDNTTTWTGFTTQHLNSYMMFGYNRSDAPSPYKYPVMNQLSLFRIAPKFITPHYEENSNLFADEWILSNSSPYHQISVRGTIFSEPATTMCGFRPWFIIGPSAPSN